MIEPAAQPERLSEAVGAGAAADSAAPHSFRFNFASRNHAAVLDALVNDRQANALAPVGARAAARQVSKGEVSGNRPLLRLVRDLTDVADHSGDER